MSPGVRRGSPWEEPVGGAGRHHEGGDAELALAVQRGLSGPVDWRPDDHSDLARALGLRPGAAATHTVSLDGLRCFVERDRARTRGPGPPPEPTELLALGSVVLGTPPARLRSWSAAPRLHVSVDGRVAHVGPASTVVVANAGFVHGDEVAPRSHPGDGRAEVQVYRLARRERRQLRERIRHAEHVPHPRIVERRGRVVEVAVERGAIGFEADGVPRGPVTRLSVVVSPSAVRLLV